MNPGARHRSRDASVTRMRPGHVLVWIVWGIALAGLAVAQVRGWITVPGWIMLVFGLVLLVFGLVWWAVGREAPRRR